MITVLPKLQLKFILALLVYFNQEKVTTLPVFYLFSKYDTTYKIYMHQNLFCNVRFNIGVN